MSFKKTVKRFIILFTLIAFAVMLTGSSSLLAASKNNLILATATTGGTYYPVGVAIATLTSIKLAKKHKITMTAITSAGSGENVQLLKNKEADLAILQGLFGAMAWQGKGKYEGTPEQNMRSVTMLWQNVEHFVVLGDYVKTGDISDMSNIKGEKFSIGKRGSGTEGSGRNILSELGINPDKDYELAYLGYTPSANALQDERIAGMNIPAGAPAGAITQAFASIGSKNIKVLEFTDQQIQKINQTYPVWSRYVIAANTYPGQKKDIRTIAQPNVLVAHPDVPEEVIYKIVKTVYENLPFLQNIHKATHAMKLNKAVDGLPAPLHPGALKYYREKGLHIPASLIQ